MKPLAESKPEIRAFAENLRWFAHQEMVGTLIADVMTMLEARFRRQSRWYVSQAMTLLVDGGFFAEARKKPTPSSAADVLDEFPGNATEEKIFEDRVSTAAKRGAKRTSTNVGRNDELIPAKVEQYLKRNGAKQLGKDVDAATKKKVRELLLKAQQERWTRTRTVRELKALWSGFTARSQGTIRNRAELIAITEIGNAYSFGTLEMAKQIQASGLTMEKAWATGAAPCQICDPNRAAGWIPLERPFPSGHDRPLAHPRCICSLMTRAKPGR
jgi:hypothetical protein